MQYDFPKLHRQVVFGESRGRIIWQPRIGCWVTDKEFAGEPFPAPFTGMDLYQIYRELGCSARLYEFNGLLFGALTPRRENHHAASSTRLDTETTIETPRG